MASPVFNRPQDRRAAERLLEHGIRSDNWSAAGFVLIVDRLDKIITNLSRPQRDEADER
jgi:hypothetical protein